MTKPKRAEGIVKKPLHSALCVYVLELKNLIGSEYIWVHLSTSEFINWLILNGITKDFRGWNLNNKKEQEAF